jgi:ABC-type amino acid transport substrate-binding protein
MFALEGALRNNVLHYVRLTDGVKRVASGEMAAVLGVRSELEAALKEAGVVRKVSEPVMPGIVRAAWQVGMAVKENSRDLGYALGSALDKLREKGKLAEICSRYGVTYAAPQ